MPPQRSSQPAPAEPSTPCKKCGLEFPTWEDFHQHKLSSSQHITCQFCSRDFHTRAACSRHQNQNHAAAQNLQCTTCGQTFMRVGGLVTHLENDNCFKVDGLTFQAKYAERKEHYDNLHNIPQVHEFGPTSGHFAEQPENQEIVRHRFSLSSQQVSRDGSEDVSASNGNAAAEGPSNMFGNPTAKTAQAPRTPVFKTTAPTLSPTYHPSPVDLMSEDPLPVDPTMLLKVDEDLISFDAIERTYETIYAQEVLKAPLSMNTAEVKAVAITKAESHITKKAEELKSIKTAAPTHTTKPVPGPSRAVQVTNATDFPELALKQSRNDGSKEADKIGTSVKTSIAANAWGTKKSLFPNAPPAVAPPTEVLASLTIKPELQDGSQYAEYDTTDPMFSAGKYWVAVIGKFKCPIRGCTKSFEKETAFRNHLNSTAHIQGRFKCRNCLRYFKTAGALSQHSESQGVRCVARESVLYECLVDEFSASAVTIAGKHADNTIRYAVVNKNSPAAINMQAVHDATNKAYEDDYNSYWKRNKPDW